MVKTLAKAKDHLEYNRSSIEIPKVLPSKLDWFPSTIEAFWKKMDTSGFSVRFGILRESS